MKSTASARWLGLTLAGALMLLAACGGASNEPGGADADPAESAEPVVGGEVTIGVNTDVTSFDPAKCFTGSRLQCNAVFGTLLAFDSENHEFTPKMAESFTPSDDGLTWTLKLRPDVTFSDGTPFDANAVAFNWDRIADPANASPAAPVANTMTWKVTDPLTVTVSLKEPNYQLPWALTYNMGLIGSPDAITKAGADVGTQPVGAGPFVLENWSPNSEVRFARNESYWDSPRPYLDAVTFKLLTADDLRADALRNDEIQINLTYTGQYAAELVNEGYHDAVDRAIVGSGLGMNTASPFLDDPDVRKAIGMLLDREQITSVIYPGDELANTFLRDGLPFESTAPLPEFDPDGAQQLIDDYLARTGESEIELDFKFADNSTVVRQLAELVQAQLQEADGVKVNVVGLQPAASAAAMASGDVQLIQGGIFGSNPDLLYDNFHSQGASNTYRYSNPEVDQALETTRTAADEEERNAAYGQATDLLTEDNVLIPYRRTDTHWLHGDDVHGVVARDGIAIDLDLVWTE